MQVQQSACQAFAPFVDVARDALTPYLPAIVEVTRPSPSYAAGRACACSHCVDGSQVVHAALKTYQVCAVRLFFFCLCVSLFVCYARVLLCVVCICVCVVPPCAVGHNTCSTEKEHDEAVRLYRGSGRVGRCCDSFTGAAESGELGWG